MNVYVYTSEMAPEGAQAIARIRMPMLGKKGKTTPGWHPVIFTGPDAETVRTQAHQWYAAEIDREQRKVANAAAAAERMKARKVAQSIAPGQSSGAHEAPRRDGSGISTNSPLTHPVEPNQ